MIHNASFWAHCILPMLMILAFQIGTFAIDFPMLYMASVGSHFLPQLVAVNSFKTLFLLLTLVAACRQWVLNLKKVSRYTPSIAGQRTRGRAESETTIFGWVMACAESVVNNVTNDVGADINNELGGTDWDISVIRFCRTRSKSA